MPGGDGEAGEATQGGQGLSSETESLHRGEVREFSQFGGGVLHSQTSEALLRHTRPVVRQLYRLSSLAPQSQLDNTGPGVQAVLEELLGGGGETEDHLATADLVDGGPGDLTDGPGLALGGLRVIHLSEN